MHAIPSSQAAPPLPASDRPLSPSPLSARADATPAPVPAQAATSTHRPAPATLTLRSSELDCPALSGSAALPTASGGAAGPPASCDPPPTYNRADYLADMRRRYRTRDMPWDRPLPPPEVIASAERLPPGRALDLGCGSGRAGIYLAQRGWQCTGVDIVPEAVALANERVRTAGVEASVRIVLGSVTRLPALPGPMDLALDIGCLHSLTDQAAQQYAAELARALRPGATYLLFGRLCDPTLADGLRGLSEARVYALFDGTMRIERVAHGTTTNVEGRAVPSAWFWLRRR